MFVIFHSKQVPGGNALGGGGTCIYNYFGGAKALVCFVASQLIFQFGEGRSQESFSFRGALSAMFSGACFTVNHESRAFTLLL